MVVPVRPTRSWRRRAPALALAVGAHLLALLALGWRIPKAPPPLPPDSLPPLDIQLLRPDLRRTPAAASPAPSFRARPTPARPGPAEPSSPSAPAVVPPPAPPLAEGPPACEAEDLPLLTDAEKARCRNQIDADKARRLARGADERMGKEVAEADRARNAFRAAADREAYYDGLVRAQQPPGLPAVGPGVSCTHMTFPLLSGVETNPNLFAKKHKQEHPPKHGSASCYAHL